MRGAHFSHRATMLSLVLALLCTCALVAAVVPRVRRRQQRIAGRKTLGFFHPYWCVRQRIRSCRLDDVEWDVACRHLSKSGGGGERVLWCALQALGASAGARVHCVVYTGDPMTVDEAFEHALVGPIGFSHCTMLPHSCVRTVSVQRAASALAVAGVCAGQDAVLGGGVAVRPQAPASQQASPGGR